MPFLSLIALLLFLPVAAHGASESKTLTIAADEWCPINCAPEAARPGIGIDLAKAAFEPLGYRVQYVVMPWARALEAVREGKVDAVVGANTTDDPTLLFPQHWIYDISDDFYVLADNTWEYEDMDSLRGRSLGIIKDYGYHPQIAAYIEANRSNPEIIQEVGGDDALQQNIRKLLAGRIEVLVESRPVMDYTLHSLKIEDRIRWAGGIPQGPVFVAFSPALETSQDRIRLYDAAMERLKRSEQLSRLYAMYGLTP